jgi:hypothetical protein
MAKKLLSNNFHIQMTISVLAMVCIYVLLINYYWKCIFVLMFVYFLVLYNKNTINYISFNPAWIHHGWEFIKMHFEQVNILSRKVVIRTDAIQPACGTSVVLLSCPFVPGMRFVKIESRRYQLMANLHYYSQSFEIHV